MAVKKAAEKEAAEKKEAISTPIKMGRPLVEINEVDLDKLLFLQCTESDCSFFFDCSVATIERWCVRVKSCTFAEYATKRQGLGKIGVRRALFQQINKGNTLLIKFACETILGMKASDISCQITGATPNTINLVLSQPKQSEDVNTQD